MRQTYQKKVALESPYIGNKVRFLQDKFQAHDSLPVFLKGKHDIRMYRGVMVFSLIGLTAALYGVTQMALGNLKKK